MEITIKKNDSAGKSISITETKNAKALFKRSTTELGRLGIVVTSMEGGVITFDLGNVAMSQRPHAQALLVNLMHRATKTVAHSEHQLSFFDLKQAAGLVWGEKTGDKDAIAVMKWADGVMAEVRKKLGAALVAKTKAVVKGGKVEDTKSGSSQRAGKPAVGKAAGTNKVASKKAASLAPSSMSAE